MKTATSKDEIDRIMKRLEAIEAQLEAERMEAFKSHPIEVQNRFVAVCDYLDEFINLGPGYRLACWYFCQSGHVWMKCNTFTPSKAWGRKHADYGASGQKWRCPRKHCWTNYTTKYGMIVQLDIRGKSYFGKAPCKDWDSLEIQAGMIEQELDPKTPEELWERIYDVHPNNFGDLFQQCKAHEVKPDVDRCH